MHSEPIIYVVRALTVIAIVGALCSTAVAIFAPQNVETITLIWAGLSPPGTVFVLLLQESIRRANGHKQEVKGESERK